MTKSPTKSLLIPFILAPMVFSAGTVAASEKISIPLSGTAVINIVTNMGVTPPLVDLGGTEVGKEATQKITLKHLGAASENNILITGVTLTGANSNEFVVEFPGATVLRPGESIDIDVTFFPVTIGNKNAALQINHDGASAEHIVFLKGHGDEQAVSELAASSTELNLGSVEMNATIKKNLTLTNQGEPNAPMITISSVEISGDNEDDFSSNFNSQIVLAPGESEDIEISLNSPTYGDKSASLKAIHDGANPPIQVALTGKVKKPFVVGSDPEFTQSEVTGVSLSQPTTLQFGPDGKLYIGEMNGTIKALTVQRVKANNYKVTNTETITLVNKMTNHDDDGTVNNSIKGRLLTGILVTGTAQNPEIYLVSGDPRQGAGPSGEDKNLDTNSGILSHLKKQGGSWVKEDLVRGLPRSEENHQSNGLVFNQAGDKLLISIGGNTNQGAPSNNFARLPEVALGGAIVEIDLNGLGATPYDLPTLDDEDRSGKNDANDPFGGNNGKNQAILKANSPVQIYAPGFRNAYDLVMTESGRLYTVDNGSNNGWGGEPINCSNKLVDAGSTYQDGLHYISHRGYYGGHPNPTRGNVANKFNDSNPQSPVEVGSNPIECNFLAPGSGDGALDIFKKSTNGLDEYTASNFGGSMQGNLLTASFDRAIYRIELNAEGDQLLSKSKLFDDAGVVPLDVTAQSDSEIFPGTVWVPDYSGNKLYVFEPVDY
ncbi:MAG: choice-of-anchor D domain-containing protein [Gammaproteobacteria bacterium]|nr:choice-of-anchor D domain-containing protein [Gammaproteobacteria bacterium]